MKFYIPLRVSGWSGLSIEVLGMPSKIDISELPSGGYIPVYKSMEDLHRDYPNISTHDVLAVESESDSSKP